MTSIQLLKCLESILEHFLHVSLLSLRHLDIFITVLGRLSLEILLFLKVTLKVFLQTLEIKPSNLKVYSPKM